MVPLFLAFIEGIISFVNRDKPKTFTLNTLRKSSILSSSTEALTPIPALLIKTSTLLSFLSLFHLKKEGLTIYLGQPY